jgi:hypothetical protein
MVGISEAPTNSVGQFLLADGGVALKLGNGYLTIDGDGLVRTKQTLPTGVDDGDVVGDQEEGED